MISRKTMGIAVALLIVLPCVLWALAMGSAAPNFDLKDQMDKQWRLSDLNGRVVVLVAADRDSGRAMGPWVDNLKSQYGSKVQILGLLDLHKIPSIGRGIAKARIRKETQDPMMIDFNGATSKSYEVSSQYPVVVVIDKQGIIRSIQKTNYNPSAYKSTTSAIDAALKAS